NDRPREAEPARLERRHRASFRRHRRARRGDACQAARRARLRPRPHLDLRGRRAGRDSDPRALSAAMELWGGLERDRLAPLVHATQAGFTEWDGETKALTYSGRFKEMLGHPREADTSGWPPFFELVHPGDRPGTLAEWRAVLQAKRSPGTQQPGAFAPLGARRRRRRVQPARAQAHAAQPAATPLRCTIVALSSNDDPITVARALASGCDYYLAKPASREALWSILAGDAPAAAAAPAAGAPPGSATPVSSTPTSPARSRR